MFAGVTLITKGKGTAVFPFNRSHYLVKPFTADGLGAFGKPWVLPINDIFKACDSFPVFDQDNQLDAAIRGPFEFSPEPFVVLANVVADFQKILLAVNDDFRVVKAHVIPDK